MKNYKNPIFFLTLILFLNILLCSNRYPVFLIHGFMGWGKNELNNYYYWGGKFDLEEYLIKNGFEVYTLSVGPVSSNWDRAIEAFYQIKGGQVDYGYNHSNEYGLIQKPETKYYYGIYPEWSEDKPIHIIGHSQGGQTARMLEYLLKNNFNNESSELLSKNYNKWIKSITTISTPHNGTTLAPIINNYFPYMQSFVIWLDIISPNSLYNFDLEQWGIYKNKNENLIDYVRKLKKSPISKTINFSSYDLSIEGAEKFNNIYETDSSTYYFTFSTTNNNNPKLMYKIQSDLMSNSKDFSEEWRENDGLVNTISMFGPSNGIIENYSNVPIKGRWQHIKKINLDHNEIIGHKINRKDLEKIKDMYMKHLKLLSTLK